MSPSPRAHPPRGHSWQSTSYGVIQQPQGPKLPWEPLLTPLPTLETPDLLTVPQLCIFQCHRWNHTVCAFTDWLLSRDVPSRSLHAFSWLVAHFLLVLNDTPLSEPEFVYPSPAKGHLGCFQVLSIMGKAAINLCLQVFGWRLSFQLLWINTKERGCWITW